MPTTHLIHPPTTIRSRSSEFDPQGLANVVSGVAAVDVPAESVKSVTTKLQGMLRGRLAEFNPQEVSNALSGLAKLGACLDDCEGGKGGKGVKHVRHVTHT